MKKAGLLILVTACIAAFLASCGQIRTLPTSVLEMAYGGEDNSDFPFEDSTGGFATGSIGDNMSFYLPAPVLSQDRAYMGSSCLKLSASFTGTGNYRGGTVGRENSSVEMSGKTLTAYVWVPNGMFDASNPYGATFYIQLADYDWYQSVWQNLNLPSGNIPGIWNKVSVYVDSMTLANGNGTPGHINGATVAENSADVNAQYRWGLKIGMGDASLPFRGTMYVDSIDLQ